MNKAENVPQLASALFRRPNSFPKSVRPKVSSSENTELWLRWQGCGIKSPGLCMNGNLNRHALKNAEILFSFCSVFQTEIREETHSFAVFCK